MGCGWTASAWRNSQHIKTIGCFRGGAPSLMFDEILSATLSKENISTIGDTQGNVELFFPPNSSVLHQAKIQ